MGDGSELTGVMHVFQHRYGLSDGSSHNKLVTRFFIQMVRKRALPYEVLSSSIYGGVSGDITIQEQVFLQ